MWGWLGGTTQHGVVRTAASAFNGIKKKRLHIQQHGDLNGRKGTCEVGCGLRSGVEEYSPDLGNRHRDEGTDCFSKQELALALWEWTPY